MPLTSKGKKVLANLKKEYKDKDKAESIFYAMINSGRLTGAEGKKRKKDK